MSNAIEGVRKIMSRELTAEKDMELYEAVTAFKQIAEKLADVKNFLIFQHIKLTILRRLTDLFKEKAKTDLKTAKKCLIGG